MHFNSDNFNLAAFEAEYAREERDRERLDALRPRRKKTKITDVLWTQRQEIEAARAAKADASLRANCVPLLRTRAYN